MIGIEGQLILTTAAMHAAEERAAATSDAMYALMERAGAGVADAVRRLAAGAEVLILCGPGNNGGDGYVAARVLREAGHPVRVLGLAEPTTDLAVRARSRWTGAVEPWPTAQPDEKASSPVFVDAVFGTGTAGPLDNAVAVPLIVLGGFAQLKVAVDLPSGAEADASPRTKARASRRYDLTLAIGALKPAHLLMPTLELCGAVRMIDLGLEVPWNPFEDQSDRVLARPVFAGPWLFDHKYTRGFTIVVGGTMPGAASLAVTAAIRAGAGYGLLLTDEPAHDLPHAVVQRRWSRDALSAAIEGKRPVLVVGPGLGRDGEARAKLEVCVDSGCPMIIDGDALHLLEERHFEGFRKRNRQDRDQHVVLTPHQGEFNALFGKPKLSKIEATRAAAERSGATVVFKGPDTVIAHPGGGSRTLAQASFWLSTAGTGDVLAGTIAGLWRAGGADPAEAGVWLHAEAARRCGASFIADDLAYALTAARASCR